VKARSFPEWWAAKMKTQRRVVAAREYHGDRPCLPPEVMMELLRRLRK
jgi:hypothetical protein